MLGQHRTGIDILKGKLLPAPTVRLMVASELVSYC